MEGMHDVMCGVSKVVLTELQQECLVLCHLYFVSLLSHHQMLRSCELGEQCDLQMHAVHFKAGHYLSKSCC